MDLDGTYVHLDVECAAFKTLSITKTIMVILQMVTKIRTAKNEKYNPDGDD